MANNPSDAPADDFLEQILGLPNFASADSGLSAADVGLAGAATQAPMMLQLNSADANAHLAGAAFHAPVYQLGLSLDQGKGGFMKPEEASASGKRFRDDVVDNRAKNVRPPPFFDSPLFGFDFLIGSEFCALLQLFLSNMRVCFWKSYYMVGITLLYLLGSDYHHYVYMKQNETF